MHNKIKSWIQNSYFFYKKIMTSIEFWFRFHIPYSPRILTNFIWIISSSRFCHKPFSDYDKKLYIKTQWLVRGWEKPYIYNIFSFIYCWNCSPVSISVYSHLIYNLFRFNFRIRYIMNPKICLSKFLSEPYFFMIYSWISIKLKLLQNNQKNCQLCSKNMTRNIFRYVVNIYVTSIHYQFLNTIFRKLRK